MRIKNKCEINIKSLILFFMLIFGFPLFQITNSTKVSIGIVTVLILIENNYFKNKMRNKIKRINNLMMTFIYLLIIVLTILITTIHNQYDFSLLKKIISAMFFVIILNYFYAYLHTKRVNIPKSIVYIFIFQAILILLSVYSETVFNFLSSFRNKISEEHIASYGRLRGNAVSGYQFFGISTMYGFVTLYLILKYKTTFIKKILILIIFLFAGTLSGRYYIVAPILGILIKILYESGFKKKILFILTGIVFLILFVKSVYRIDDMISSPQLKEKYKNYIIKPLEDSLKEKKMTSSSTDGLSKMYTNNIYILKEIILVGEGRYEDEIDNKKYYRAVDSGYLRMIFYYGIFGVIILLYASFYMIFLSNKDERKKNLDLKIAFFIYILLLNVKGDIFIYTNSTLPIILGLINYNTLELK